MNHPIKWELQKKGRDSVADMLDNFEIAISKDSQWIIFSRHLSGHIIRENCHIYLAPGQLAINPVENKDTNSYLISGDRVKRIGCGKIIKENGLKMHQRLQGVFSGEMLIIDLNQPEVVIL